MTAQKIFIPFLALLICIFAAEVKAGLDPPHNADGNNIGCLSCHDLTSSEPKHLPSLGHTAQHIDDTVANSLCWSCHSVNATIPYAATHSSLQTDASHGDWTVECWVCHNQHIQKQEDNGSSYGMYIRRSIDLANIKGADGNTFVDNHGTAKSGKKSVVFTGNTGANSFADGDIDYNGICEVCHTTTSHFRSNGSGPDQLHNIAPDGDPAKIGAGVDCMMCHKHGTGFAANMPSHSATPGSDWVVVFAENTHDDVMVGDGAVYAGCALCHNTRLSDAHDYQCLACHPSPAGTVVGSWGGGCQQGGCHPVIHADVSAAHNTVVDDCSNCHGAGWSVTSDACANCHALYNPADTTPPETTSNAQATYLGPARIEYSVRDGGKVVVAQTYSRVDGGSAEMGSSIVVTGLGSHALEFWSVDQANNIESPPNVVNFAIVEDTTPPVTTSNAQALYYQEAYILLSAGDDSDLGVKATYYSLDGGTTQTGSLVHVPGTPGTFDHTLEFWSEDWSGNVEDVNTAQFSITAGTGTFRMWGGGTSCANDPAADAFWFIKRNNYNGTVLAQGTDGCDVVFDVGPGAYYVMVEFWNPVIEGWDEHVYGTYYLTTHGQVITLD